MSSVIGTKPSPLSETRAREVVGSPKRILYVEQNIDGTVGGSYRSLLFLLRGLDRTAYQPIVLFYRHNELLGAYKDAGVETMVFAYPRFFDLVTPLAGKGVIGAIARPFAKVVQKTLNLTMYVVMVLRHASLLIVKRIDILHLNNGVTVGHEFLIPAKLLGRGVIIHQRGITPVKRWYVWLARRADHVICVSEAARENLLEHGLWPDKTTAIHNGMDPDALRRQIKRDVATVRESIGIRPDELIVGLAGMIRVWKGQMVLVKAMALLKKTHPQLRAVIMGGIADQHKDDVAYLNEIKDYIREHGLDRSVLLLDYQSNAPEYLQIFDIMVHTAIDPEPFSRVVIEGMALGRPIVASATGGTPEAIDHGVSGLLVPANDPEALASQIALLADNPDMRDSLGRGAVEKLERRFHIRSHVARTEAIYAGLLGGK
jgi:glycosyltransferase involved in cell wall biosynthesis